MEVMHRQAFSSRTPARPFVAILLLSCAVACRELPPNAHETGLAPDGRLQGAQHSEILRPATSRELVRAVAAGGRIEVQPGVYRANLRITRPTTLVAVPGTVEIWPVDPLAPTVEVQRTTDVTVSGLIIHNGAPDRDAVVIGSLTATTAAEQPDNITFEHNRIVAGNHGGHRGIALHGRKTTIRHNRIENFFEIGRESQGICGWNGPGPYLIEDNFIEASGENIMFGGAHVHIPNMNPSNIRIRRNVLYKPKRWQGTSITVKNSFELKTGIDVVFEDNTIDGNWAMGQAGTPIVLTPRGIAAFPWAQVDRVVIRNNVVKNAPDAYAVNILGLDDLGVSQPIRNLTIEDNLFLDSPRGLLIDRAGELTLMVRRNAFLGIKDHFIQSNGPALPRFDFLENVARTGAYGVHRSDATVGSPAWQASRIAGDFRGNVIEQPEGYALQLPTGNKVISHGGLAALLTPEGRLRDRSAGPR